MSRQSKPKTEAATAAAASETQAAPGAAATPDPAAQVPDTTGAATASAAAAAAPVDPKPAKAAKAPAVVTVKGPTKGRWRAGRHFGPEPVEIPLEELSKADVERLKADPELLCTWPA